MSEIKVNKISPRTACGTTTLGDSGDTFTLPSGATISNSGTAAGFGGTGEISWDTTVKTTGTFTATAGVGYFLNTTGGTITVNLPAGAAGSSVAMVDYAGTWQTSNVTVTPNGSEKVGGVAASAKLSTEGQSVTFVYIDTTRGWVNVLDSTSNVVGNNYVTASGGNATVTCGDYKTHVFTGPGTFTVSNVGGSCGPTGSNKVEYLVVAGGGGGGLDFGGGGGAGGFRTYTALPGTSPLNAPAALPVAVQGYPIAVGAAGTGGIESPFAAPTQGGTSTFSTIDSAGGGFGGSAPPKAGGDGGSGGGGKFNGGPTSGGSGNTPPVSPSQGNNGGPAPTGPPYKTGGGGGAGAAGATSTTNSPPAPGAPGGIGSHIPDAFVGPTAPSYGTPGPTGSVRYFAGGGGAGGYSASSGAGGSGGGGGPSPPSGSDAGDTNTGGGGGGAPNDTPGNRDGANGGSGIVMIRYKYQ